MEAARGGESTMKNVHQRLLAHPIDAVRPLVAQAWSGTPDDVFPRDVIPTWRENPPGVTGLVPGVTRLGHGPFRFRLTAWDGVRWRVGIEGGAGYHGFDLEACGDQTRSSFAPSFSPSTTGPSRACSTDWKWPSRPAKCPRRPSAPKVSACVLPSSRSAPCAGCRGARRGLAWPLPRALRAPVQRQMNMKVGRQEGLDFSE
jgi:hypothetical protein